MRSLLVLAAAATLAIAGCGGDDDTTDTSGTSGATGVAGVPLSQDEFVSQGNAICDDVNTQLRDLQAPDGNDLQSIADYAEQGIAIVEPALEQFQALTPPEDLQSTWDEYLSSAEEQIELDRQLQAAAAAGDQKQVESLIQQLQELDNDSVAKELGLDTCAEDSSPAG